MLEKTLEKKRVAIIGAGISGMTAGIYSLDNNFDVTIYERHKIPGGQCTGWVREKTYIDGCAHWIVGTNPSSDLYPIWKHIGALNDNSVIYDTEYFSKYDIDGEIITLYSDLTKLEEEFLRISPQDKPQIKKFINGIKGYSYVKIPTKKPLDKMNLFELMCFGVKMLPMAIKYIRYKKISVEEYAKNFKSPILQKLFLRMIEPNYNIHSLFYILQALSKNDAGALEGGSINFARNIQKTFINNGGRIITNTEVKKIIVKDNKAKGLVLDSGEEVYYDYIVGACDITHLLNDLLDEKYTDKYYLSRFKNRNDYPLNTSMQISIRCTKDLTNYPKMINFSIEKIQLADTSISFLSMRNHSYDITMNRKYSLLTVLIPVLEGVYDYYHSLSKEEYIKEKNKFGTKILKEVENYLGFNSGELTLIDVTTPLTYERYTNAYKGSYMSYITTKKSKGLMRPGILKGLNNFVIAGQWLMSPGGLPIAAFTGKHAAYRLCLMENKKFIDLDNSTKDLKLIKIVKPITTT